MHVQAGFCRRRQQMYRMRVWKVQGCGVLRRPVRRCKIACFV
jgi:hypothetical protein